MHQDVELPRLTKFSQNLRARSFSELADFGSLPKYVRTKRTTEGCEIEIIQLSWVASFVRGSRVLFVGREYFSRVARIFRRS